MLVAVKNFFHAPLRSFVADLLGNDYRYSLLVMFWVHFTLLRVTFLVVGACEFTGVTFVKVFATMTL